MDAIRSHSSFWSPLSLPVKHQRPAVILCQNKDGKWVVTTKVNGAGSGAVELSSECWNILLYHSAVACKLLPSKHIKAISCFESWFLLLHSIWNTESTYVRTWRTVLHGFWVGGYCIPCKLVTSWSLPFVPFWLKPPVCGKWGLTCGPNFPCPVFTPPRVCRSVYLRLQFPPPFKKSVCAPVLV